MRGDPTAPHHRGSRHRRGPRSRDTDYPIRLGRDPLPERGAVDRRGRRRARQALRENGYEGEVVVADNGSTDGSPELAEQAGARVVHEKRRGYGSAYLAGFAAAEGEYIVMADADLTYDFADIPRFVQQLDAGAELVMGNRMKNIQPGAMPWHHRYIGNPVLTGVLNLFFRTGVRDAHCGMRAIRREALPGLDLRSPGWSSPRRWSSALRRTASTSARFRSSTTRAPASRSCRASATAGAISGSCWFTARPSSS